MDGWISGWGRSEGYRGWDELMDGSIDEKTEAGRDRGGVWMEGGCINEQLDRWME